jgi:hypothetical protein
MVRWPCALALLCAGCLDWDGLGRYDLGVDLTDPTTAGDAGAHVRNGGLCTSGAECTSGICAQPTGEDGGVCCATTCPGTCRSCQTGECLVAPDLTQCGPGSCLNNAGSASREFQACVQGVCTSVYSPCAAQTPLCCAPPGQMPFCSAAVTCLK